MQDEGTPEVAVSESDIRMWTMILHLSQLAIFVLPVAGIVAPISIWQLKKDEMPTIDEAINARIAQGSCNVIQISMP